MLSLMEMMERVEKNATTPANAVFGVLAAFDGCDPDFEGIQCYTYAGEPIEDLHGQYGAFKRDKPVSSHPEDIGAQKPNMESPDRMGRLLTSLGYDNTPENAAVVETALMEFFGECSSAFAKASKTLGDLDE